MNISKSELLKALQRALPGVEKGSSLLEGADTFIFENGFCFTYNNSISVRVPVPGELSGSVKAQEFHQLLSKMADDDLDITVEEKTWTIKCGAAEVEMSLLQAGVMAQIQQLVPEEGWKKLPEEFLSGVGDCMFSSNRSSLSGVFVDQNSIYSTDEIRINRFTLSEPMDRFWLADSSANELIKLQGLEEYIVDKTWVHFRTSEGTIFSIKRLADAKFPVDKLTAVIKAHEPVESDNILSLPTKLKEAVERATALSMDIDSQELVKLTLTKSNIIISSGRSTGKFKETVEWSEAPGDDFEEMSIYIDYAMIAYGLKRSSQVFSRFTRTESGSKVYRLIFFGDTVIHVISTKSAE